MPRPLPRSDADRWQAVVDGDKEAGASFVIAVKTTGIYCRAGCPARRPHRENVRFFDTTAEAQAAGFRACKRCRPDSPAPTPAPDGPQ